MSNFFLLPLDRPFGDYYLDFGASGDPFTFNGVEWIALGWDIYDIETGYGWNSMAMNLPNTIQPGNPILTCVDAGSGNLVESTICYDDYNHPDEFHFQIHPGKYEVTIGIGWPDYCRADTEFVQINNVVLRNYTCGDTDCCGVRNYTETVGVWEHANFGDLVMTFGNNQGYTILSYLIIIGKDDSEPEPGFGVVLHDYGGGGGGGVSPGGKAALVIIFLILPLCAGGACAGWIVWRKHKSQPIIPSNVGTKAKLVIEGIKLKLKM